MSLCCHEEFMCYFYEDLFPLLSVVPMFCKASVTNIVSKTFLSNFDVYKILENVLK